MTAHQPPLFIQEGTLEYGAEDLRFFLTSVLGRRGGIIGATDLAVVANGTPNMNVIVADGAVAIPGTLNGDQGLYLCDNRGTTTVTLDAAHATNPRYDLIIAKIEDNEYAGSAFTWSPTKVTGTAAASPTEPSLPDNAVQLARVTVAALDTTITNADILDRRLTTTKGQATALGGIVVTTSGNIPTTGLYEGLFVYLTDVDRFVYYNGSAWVGVGAAAAAQPQVFFVSVSGGTATSFTAFATHNSILTAPYALTMVVRLTGEIGSNGAINTETVRITDEAGSTITRGGTIEAGAITYKVDRASAAEPLCVFAHKDYAAGATCGFRCEYKVDASTVSINAWAEVNFYPKVA